MFINQVHRSPTEREARCSAADDATHETAA